MSRDQVFPLKISLDGILQRDPSTLAMLLKACTLDGCFRLDLQGSKEFSPDSLMFDHAKTILSAADQVFAKPLEEKVKWQMDKWGELCIGGYKPIGKHSGVGPHTRDGFENFLIPLDLFQESRDRRSRLPEPLQSRESLLEQFELKCHEIARSVLCALSEIIPQKPVIAFENLHRTGRASTSSLATLKYPAHDILQKNHVGHMAHTDVGSLTFLFTSSPGLEVNTCKGTWAPVCPGPQQIIINVGDTLHFMSGQQFQSCLHRVAPNICEAGHFKPRFSLAFFLRPELTARFTDANGREWTGEEWHLAKYKIFRANDIEQENTSLLTGRKGFLGKWDIGYNI